MQWSVVDTPMGISSHLPLLDEGDHTCTSVDYGKKTKTNKPKKKKKKKKKKDLKRFA